MANVNKRDLVDEIARRTGCVRRDVQMAIDGFIALVGENMSAGRTIEIRGFGTFACRPRKARPARNPHTGETVHLDARNVPTFKFSGDIKCRVAQP